MSMSEVVLKGYTNAPAEGSAGAFYGNQFVFSYVDWIMKIAYIKNYAKNHKPALMTKKVTKGSFVYFYQMNEKGKWVSQFYTTKAIANGPKDYASLTEWEANDCMEGITRCPKAVPGTWTGTFRHENYVRTGTEWKMVTRIAKAYLGEENIECISENGYTYLYFVNEEKNVWYSMVFTNTANITKEEEVNHE
ncbi:MAG: hypothetical protein NC548_13030 [Lachnospiraceae bacterium]|nr:hypothetical protein [Lachnospiraceae bacterium]MCM1230687.1 hypothetical protein [Ruminococcus flavefaciens]